MHYKILYCEIYTLTWSRFCSELNGSRQLHKQQLKAWLSLFFLITSEVLPCIQSRAFTTKRLLMCICDDQGLIEKLGRFPPTTRHTLVPRLHE